MIKYVLPLKLPSLNDYVDKCRTHKQVGASFKKKVEKEIGRCFEEQGIKKTDKLVDVKITFYEANRMRDKDNVISSTKYIMDSMVHKKIIPDDNWKYINQYYPKVLLSNNKTYRVEIELIEVE